MEQNQPMVTKKIWSMVRIVYFMVRKGISKGKLMLNLKYMMTKRGKIAGKALGNFMLHLHHHLHHDANAPTATSTSSPHNLSFRNHNHFEFRCSNSPAFFGKFRRHQSLDMIEDDVATFSAVKATFEMMRDEEYVDAPPSALPDVQSPMDRTLMENNHGDGDCQVDKAAVDFINRFYKQLKLQMTE